jgi:hypothetical protein
LDINDCTAEVILASDFGDAFILTAKVKGWLPILAEFNTHRQHNEKNARSQRAVPTKTLIGEVLSDPFMPYATQYTKGMVANTPLMGWRKVGFDATHKLAAYLNAAITYIQVNVWGANKGVASRYLTPFLMSHQIVTWYIPKNSFGGFENFLNLRTADDAEPHFRQVAQAFKAIYETLPDIAVTPPEDRWHIPMLLDNELDLPLIDRLYISAGRTAMVSYHIPGTKEVDADKDITRAKRMATADQLHATPFGHQVKQLSTEEKSIISGKWALYNPGGALSHNVLQFRQLMETYRHIDGTIHLTNEDIEVFYQ